MQVCLKAFISILGITSSRVQTIRESLAFYGSVMEDRRGKHENRFQKISEGTIVYLITFGHDNKNNTILFYIHLKIKNNKNATCEFGFCLRFEEWKN